MTIAELLGELADDPAAGTLCFLLESLADGRAFVEQARAVTPNRPVVVVKTGKSEAGARAASSHTAALAADTAIWRGRVPAGRDRRGRVGPGAARRRPRARRPPAARRAPRRDHHELRRRRRGAVGPARRRGPRRARPVGAAAGQDPRDAAAVREPGEPGGRHAGVVAVRRALPRAHRPAGPLRRGRRRRPGAAATRGARREDRRGPARRGGGPARRRRARAGARVLGGAP